MSERDYSDFRESGVLSDFTVTVDGKEFKLHKFPLYTRSEYFGDIVRGHKNDIELTDFPGGSEIFGLVADFCYNVDIHLTTENCVPLRCAAEVLGMRQGKNLVQITDRYIQDVLSAANVNEDIDVVASILRICALNGQIADDVDIVTKCIDTCVEIWLRRKHNKLYTRFARTDIKQSNNCVEIMCNLPLDYFVKFLRVARYRDVRSPILTDLVQKYLTINVEKYYFEDSTGKTQITGDVSKKEEADNKEDDRRVTAEWGQNERHNELKSIIDRILSEVPEDPQFFSSVSPEWLTEMIRMTCDLKCKNRSVLLRAAAGILHRLGPEDLACLPASTVHDAIKESTSKPNTLCGIADSYLMGLAKQGKLDYDTFIKLATVIPMKERDSCDKLLQTLEVLLEKGQNRISNSEDENKWITALDIIDSSKLHEDVLTKSLEAEVVPSSYITSAALSLCRRLRSELEDAKSVICIQEADIRQSRQERTHRTLQKTYQPASKSTTWKSGLRVPVTSHRKSLTVPITTSPYTSDSSDALDYELAGWKTSESMKN